MLPAAFHASIPEERAAQARAAADIMGDLVFRKYPFAGGTKPMVGDRAEALLNRTWRPALSIVGADDLPAIADAGNVLRPRTALKLSLRLPPLLDGERATQDLKRLLEADPPHGAAVHFEADQGATGWNAPPTAAWLAKALDEASRAFYDKPAAAMGEGGTIPFMAMLGKHFPDAQFLITGVLGPQVQRARAQRVPAHSLCDEVDRVRGTRVGGARARAPGESIGQPRPQSGQRQYLVPPACERADQQARDVGDRTRVAAALRSDGRARLRPSRCRASTSRGSHAGRCDRRSRRARGSRRGRRTATAVSRAAPAPRRAAHGARATDSAPTHAPAHRLTCRAKHGPDAASRAPAPSSTARARRRGGAASRAPARFDVNGTVAARELAGFDAGRGNVARRARLFRQFEHARFGLAPQRMVVRGQHRLDERGFAQKRADLACRLLEFDAADFRATAVGRSASDSRTRNARRRARAGCGSCRCTAAAR